LFTLFLFFLLYHLDLPEDEVLLDDAGHGIMDGVHEHNDIAEDITNG
jgi:hypothetical protein